MSDARRNLNRNEGTAPRSRSMRLLFSPLSAVAIAPPIDEQCEREHDK
jgi:hypothetical protein